MPLNPPLREAPRFPLTSLVALAAIAASLRFWTTHTVSGLAPTSGSILHEPWTLITSIFPHVDPVHLLFNLSWWWVLGTRIEHAGRAARFIGVVILLAIVSTAAEFALWHGGVGLSGVIYGLATLLWVVQSRYPALEGTITRRTLEILGAWFVLCVVLTITNVLPVGNFAHGAGAICGWLLGKCIIAAPRRRAPWCAALAAALLLTITGATIARPWVNLGQWIGSDAYRGYSALEHKNYDDAIHFLEAVALKQPNDFATLANLGSAYVGKERFREARDAYIRATTADPSKKDSLAPTIALIFDHDTDVAAKRNDLEAVKSLAAESLKWNPNGAYPKQILEWARATEEEKKKPHPGD